MPMDLQGSHGKAMGSLPGKMLNYVKNTHEHLQESQGSMFNYVNMFMKPSRGSRGICMIHTSFMNASRDSRGNCLENYIMHGFDRSYLHTMLQYIVAQVYTAAAAYTAERVFTAAVLSTVAQV